MLNHCKFKRDIQIGDQSSHSGFRFEAETTAFYLYLKCSKIVGGLGGSRWGSFPREMKGKVEGKGRTVRKLGEVFLIGFRGVDTCWTLKVEFISSAHWRKFKWDSTAVYYTRTVARLYWRGYRYVPVDDAILCVSYMFMYCVCVCVRCLLSSVRWWSIVLIVHKF